MLYFSHWRVVPCWRANVVFHEATVQPIVRRWYNESRLLLSDFAKSGLHRIPTERRHFEMTLNTKHSKFNHLQAHKKSNIIHSNVDVIFCDVWSIARLDKLNSWQSDGWFISATRTLNIYIYILLTVTNRNIRKWYYNSFQVPVDILQAIPSDLSQFIETLHPFIIRAITKSVQTKTQSNFGETQSVIFAYLLFSLPIFNRITFKSSCYCYTKTNRLIFATLNT